LQASILPSRSAFNAQRNERILLCLHTR
jgi:hypothetical protein